MKIQCDVCEKEEATMFCSADEAALCDGCDRRVHRANKLASKHSRYSLLRPSFKDSPLCDICQERRALLFCLEDRAILCRECDIPIHGANEQTQKHNRFLLTGVRLSPSSSSAPHYQPPPLPTSSSTRGIWRQETSSPSKLRGGFVNQTFEVCPSGASGSSSSRAFLEEESQMVVSDGGSMPTSSISEYLMETLPGWRVDEFLDCHHVSHHHSNINNNSPTSHGYCKTVNRLLPMPEYEVGSNTSSGSSASRDLPTPVPFQFLTQPHRHHHHHRHHNDFPLRNSFPQNQTTFLDGAGEAEKA